MIPQRGYVTGLDRAGCTAQVQVIGGPIVTAVFLQQCPPMQAVVWVYELAGRWLLLGVEGGMQIAVRDEFLHISNPAGTNIAGDTGWLFTGTAGSILTSGASGFTGAVSIVTTAVSGQFIALSKANNSLVLPAIGSPPLWVSGRFTNDATFTNNSVFVGLGNNLSNQGQTNAANAAAVGIFTSSGSKTWKLRTTNGAATNDLDTGVPSAASSTIYFDLLIVGGSYAALWVNGGSGIKTSVNIPPANTVLQAPQLCACAQPSAAQACGIVVDYLQVATVPAYVDPT